jgi:hypothetical protein
MSYIERATYDFFKKSLTDGIKVLLSRKFLLFSVLLALIGIINGIFTYAYSVDIEIPGIDLTIDLINILLFVEISLSVAFIVIGLFSRILKTTLVKSIIAIIIWVILAAFGFITLTSGPNDLVTSLSFLVAVICLLSWTLFIPLSTLWASYGLFYSKITASILFLGKPAENNKAIFSGIMALIGVIGLAISIILFNYGFVIVGVTIALLSLLVILIVRGVIVKNDAFNSMIGFFYILLVPSMLLLIYSYLEQGAGTAGTLSYIILTFSLLYSAQGVVKKIKLEKVDELTESLSKVSEEDIEKSDPFFLGRIVSLFGGEGIVLILLGSILGYHVLQLQMFLPELNNEIFMTLFQEPKVSQVYQILNLGFASFIIFFLVFFYLISSNVKEFYKPNIYRLGFLPSYDELVDFFERVKSGEVNWTEFAAKAAFKGTMKSTKAVASVSKRGVGALLAKAGSLLSSITQDSEDDQ